MVILLFVPRFHDLVASGAVRQTIRGPRSRPIPPGAHLSLRAWTGPAYHSPQRVLREAICVSVEPILIRFAGTRPAIEVAGMALSHSRVSEFVRADGFEDTHDFTRWWAEHRTAPFEGCLIRWEPLP